MNEFLDGFKKGFGSLLNFNTVFFNFKKIVFKSVLELSFLIIGIICIIVGLSLFFSRFLSWDLILLVVGLILVNIVFGSICLF